MKALATKLAALGFAVLLLAGSATQIDAQDKDSDTKITKDAKPAGVLTAENIKEKLENLGFEPKHNGNTPADIYYRINLNRDDYRFALDVGLSKNGQNVWFLAPLRQLPEPKDVRPDILEKMLALNDKIGPTHMSMGSNRMLYLNVAIENRDITPVRLRQVIDSFCNDIRGSESLWNPSRYPDLSPTPNAKKEVANTVK